MKNSIPCIAGLALATLVNLAAAEPARTPFNVLFIAVDDLNDWVGCLGGNPQAITPNLDRLAKEHGMVMNKAYAPSTVCCPSRTSLLTGKRPSSTGVYSNQQDWTKAPKAKDVVTLPEYFGRHGYRSVSTGKIFHGSSGNAFHERGELGGFNGDTLWKESPAAALGKSSGKDVFVWGASKAPVEKTRDYAACQWAVEQLKRDFDGKPFFISLGIAKPHLPWFVPQQFFDLYPLEKIKPVEIFRADLDDILRKDGRPIFKPNEWFQDADKAEMHNQAQRAYLASISYVDHCLGLVFDALQKSKYADNTIIMIWGDHGWHLSEKLKYGKIDLWEESARVPFIVCVPGVTKPGLKCDGVVNLLDMYPTLVELCGLPPNPENEGRSFAPLLRNPKLEWNHPTLSTYHFKNHSLTDGRYRYTWYGGRADGAEELYDHSTDPLEQRNLATKPESKEIIAHFKKHLPAHDEPNSPSGMAADAGKNGTTKETGHE